MAGGNSAPIADSTQALAQASVNTDSVQALENARDSANVNSKVAKLGSGKESKQAIAAIDNFKKLLEELLKELKESLVEVEQDANGNSKTENSAKGPTDSTAYSNTGSNNSNNSLLTGTTGSAI